MIYPALKKKKGSSYKKEAIKIAKDLCYSPEIIYKIEHAESDKEVERILHDARVFND